MTKLELFPQEVIDLQRELLRPEHAGLSIKLSLQYGDEAQEGDLIDALTKLATVAEIRLDGDYTIKELSAKILEHVRKQRIRDSIIDITGYTGS